MIPAAATMPIEQIAKKIPKNRHFLCKSPFLGVTTHM